MIVQLSSAWGPCHPSLDRVAGLGGSNDDILLLHNIRGWCGMNINDILQCTHVQMSIITDFVPHYLLPRRARSVVHNANWM